MSENAPLAEFTYRPRLGMILMIGAFFGLGVVVLGHKHHTTGELEALLGALASGGFVLLAMLLLGLRTFRPQQVRVFADHVEVPAGRLGTAQRRIALADVSGLQVVSMSGQVSAVVEHPGGPSTLQRAMFPCNEDFDDVLALLETGLWRGEPAPDAPRARSDATPPSPPAPPAVVAAQMGAARPWWGLGMKLGALAAFCGGPLRAADALRPIIGKDPGFGAAFAPIALLLFGSFAVLEDEPTRWTRAVVALGLLGALAVGASDLWALGQVLRGPARGDDGLIAIGSVLGLALVAAYAWAASRFWRRPLQD
jgi:hypothetical protein